MSVSSLLPWPNPRWKENPYQRIIYAGLSANGVRIRRTPPLFSMLPYWPRSDWLHLNWPENRYADRDPDRRARQLTQFLKTVQKVKQKGTKVLWTLHNEFPHDEDEVAFFRTANERLCELSDLIHVHFPQAAEHLQQSYGVKADAIHVMAHPHYGDYYGSRISKTEARAAIGLDAEARVILVFGYVRRYKGIESAVEALLRTEDDRLRLVVVGKPEHDGVVDLLRSAAEREPRLVLRLSHVPANDVMPLFAAADVFLLASRHFFTSGSLMLALTYRVPVIAVPRNHATIFVGGSFFKPWEPPTTERLTAIMEDLDDWLGHVRFDDLEEVREKLDIERLARGLSARLTTHVTTPAPGDHD